jgi:hypothetical protein
VDFSQQQWEKIVEHARRGRDPKELADKNASEASIRGKMKAVRWAIESGWSYEDITEKGQTAVRSAYERSKRNGAEPQKVLRWRVSKSLADAIMSSEASVDQEEALASRLVRVLGMQTSEQFWEFLHSVFADLSDAELKNLAGAFTEKDAPKKRRYGKS